MTTPAGVPNLPIGALTVETLGQRLQDQTAAAMRDRAGEQMPSIFGLSTGGDIMSDLSPFGILTNIWAGVNSLIANSDPNDIQGPEDLPPLFMDFIEGLPVIGQFVQLLEALLGTYDGEDTTLQDIQDFIEPIRILVSTIGQEIADWLHWLVNTLFNGSTDPLTNIFTTLAGLLDEAGTLTTWLDGLLTDTWETLLTTLQSLFGDFDLETFLAPLFDFFSWLWNGVSGGFAGFSGTVDTVLKPVITWLNSLWTNLGSTVLAAFNNLIKSISTLISLPTLQTLIEKIATALTGIVNPTSFTDLLISIVNYFKSLFQTGSVTDFTKNLPIIGPLVSAITGLTEADGVALDFGTLGTFFRKLEQKATISDDVIGDIGRKVLGGILSIGMLNKSEPNLLSQGDFATAATIEAGGGWSWDNTVSASSTGGALLATATGSLQQMYSKQSINVLANDKIAVSGSVLTSGFTSGSITLSIVYWVGSSSTTHVVSTRTSAASTFQAMTGSTILIGGTAGSGEIAIPSNATSIQVRLAVNANAGAKVWFDDIAVKKTGLVEQTWVDKLPETWAGAWNAVFGSGGTGKIWSDFVTALNTTFTAANLGASGSTTNAGNITTIIDDIGKAVFGEAGYSSLSKTAKQSIQQFIKALFGVTTIQTELSGDVMPPLDGTTISGEIPVDSIPDLPGGIITSGEIPVSAVPDLPGGIITSGTIDAGRLPSTVGAVGSGVAVSRTNSGSSYVTMQASSTGVYFVQHGFYTNIGVTTGDLVYEATSAGAASIRAKNAGWYQVEVCFRLKDDVQYDYWWSFTPSIHESRLDANKFGATVMSSRDTNGGASFSMTPLYAQASFIVYMNAGNYVCPCYTALRENNTLGTYPLLGSASPSTTYFSAALLNRSLV